LDDQPDNALKVRYLAGECTPEERTRVEAWLREDPSRRAELEALGEAWRALVALRPQPDWRPAFAQLQQRLGMRGQRELSEARRPAARVGGARAAGEWLRQRSAPFVAGLFVAGVAAVVAIVVRIPVGPKVGSRQYATVPGQRETVTLEDGTQFTLAPATRLRIAADYGRGRRDVYLDGEGYFVVRHDAAHPFAVHAKNGIAEDVGTRFAVSAYSEAVAVQVAVAEGEVALGDSASKATARAAVSAGRVATVDGGGRTLVGLGDVDEVLAWTRGELAFDRTPLSEVARRVSRWYGLDVKVGDAVGAARNFTGRFTTETPDEVLATIGRITGTVVVRRGSTITITAR
jgi:transmembrane sensor